MKILCHVGPWCKEYFEYVSRGFDPSAEVVLCSGFRTLDQTRLAELYKRRFGELKLGGAVFVSDADRNVIARCRLLRTFTHSEAALHVHAVRFAVRVMLSEVEPDVFLSETTDQFLHQILFEECELHGVPAFGIVQTFVNGYFRVSRTGERCSARTASASECTDVLQKLEDKSYIPKFIVNQKKNLRKAYYKSWITNIARVVYFAIFRRIVRDFLNYHYWASSRSIYLNHVHFLPSGDIGSPDWENKIRDEGRPSIFIPLQFFPEATIDYWVRELEFLDYENALIKLLMNLSRDFQFIVKEHPGVWGNRQPSFYRKLGKVPGVIFCPTSVAAQDCIDVCDATLVWTGSVGFEAALRGKPVMTVTEPYYQSGRRFKHIGFSTTSEEILAHINWVRANEIDRDEKVQLIRYLLDGMDRGRIQVDGSFSASRAPDVTDAMDVGRMVRRHYESHVAS